MPLQLAWNIPKKEGKKIKKKLIPLFPLVKVKNKRGINIIFFFVISKKR